MRNEGKTKKSGYLTETRFEGVWAQSGTETKGKDFGGYPNTGVYDRNRLRASRRRPQVSIQRVFTNHDTKSVAFSFMAARQYVA